MARSALLNVMVQAVMKAARTLRRDFGEVEQLQVSLKGPGDFVTLTDKKVEKILQEELYKARPDYGFLMEESGQIEGRGKDHRWIIDPIDGTTNFMHAIPHFAISVAAEHRGQLTAGVIYNPITDELFTAEKGNGAFLNDKYRLRVSSRRDLEEAVIACGIPHIGRGDHKLFQQELTKVMGTVAGIRRMGSAALDLAYVAAGRYDGYWERHLSPWDVAAGIILMREAGGIVTSLDPKEDMLTSGTIIAGNGTIHTKLEKLIKN